MKIWSRRIQHHPENYACKWNTLALNMLNNEHAVMRSNETGEETEFHFPSTKFNSNRKSLHAIHKIFSFHERSRVKMLVMLSGDTEKLLQHNKSVFATCFTGSSLGSLVITIFRERNMFSPKSFLWGNVQRWQWITPSAY